MLKKISEIITVAIPVLILCSCLQMITYYKTWNISIIRYLTGPEILFSFVEPGIIMLLLLGSYLFSNFIVLGSSDWLVTKLIGKEEKEKKGETKTEEIENNKKKQKRLPKIISYLVSIALCIGLAYLYFDSIWNDYNVVVAVMFHVTLWTLALYYIKKFLKNSLSAIPLFLASSFTLLSASFFYGRFKAHDTVKSPVHEILYLENSKPLTTGFDILFLGKTSEYYFLYDKKLNQSVILPKNKITKEIVITSANSRLAQ